MSGSQRHAAMVAAASLPPETRRFAHHAMATIFEIAIAHEDAVYAEQCAHEAFRELDRLERALSRFIANSDVSRVNAARVGEAVRVGADTFDCLRHCAALSAATNGACDVSIGALLEYWSRADAGGADAGGAGPGGADANGAGAGGADEGTDGAEDVLEAIVRASGMDKLLLDEKEHTVVRRTHPLSVDLGGYGKGYAVDAMARVLDDWDIDSALLHGGTSSVLALDAPPGERGWQVTLRHPSDREQVIGRFYLEHLAVSGSGLRKGFHIIDPRTGCPASEARAAWALTRTAASGDALSTAFMVMSPDEIRAYRAVDAETRAIVIRRQPGGTEAVLRFGDCRPLERA